MNGFGLGNENHAYVAGSLEVHFIRIIYLLYTIATAIPDVLCCINSKDSIFTVRAIEFVCCFELAFSKSNILGLNS